MSAASPPSAIFPERLRTAREYRGLTQGQLAERANLQPSAISHFETGARKPSFDNLRLLADTLDVTTDYLLGRVEEFKSLAGADKLHRHYENLQQEDRKFADELITLLASKAKSKDKK
ncbi:helix-turn-helix domain-containing protein [Piscinibacter koreensis]|uniref:Helix-turn-helix transcriptional regulator n=1 Tax=Piscinibacter koreensis TaxID=2742824 RepID=A0A7Y6TY70_9BURK|nr:helix-turn-helix transcriptional regulator [Schlegelella koreensis]NUZ07894.1 helix-turn-helix transcriptional regulator [Schlegelella koreensis]